MEKRRFSAFIQGSSDLHAILGERGIDTVIVTGTLTNVCSLTTALDAMMLNYKVLMVSDANAALGDDAHNTALATVCELFGDVRTTDEVVALLEQLGAIWAPVRSYDEVVSDPQVLASGYLRRIDHPEYGQIVSMGMPLRFSGGVPEPADRAPNLGEDTELILEEAGYSWARIGELRDQGAIQ